jgi:hypothetical protein
MLLTISRKKIVDVGLHPLEIQSRFNHIKVYCLVDETSALINIAVEKKQSICPVFFTHEIARVYQQKIQIRPSGEKKGTLLAKISLNHFLRHLTNDSNALTDARYRFVPHPQEVRHALKSCWCWYPGKPSNQRWNFVGTPLFQAQTIKIQNLEQTKPTPLFLEEMDLKNSFLYAFCKKEKNRIIFNKQQSNSLILNRTLEWPHVKVCCVEWILQQLESEKEDTWAEMIVVPSGLIGALRNSSLEI